VTHFFLAKEVFIYHELLSSQVICEFLGSPVKSCVRLYCVMIIHCHASFLGYAVLSYVSACEQAPAATYAPTAGYRLGNGGKYRLMRGKMR